jgi:hypothetical protein
MKKHLFVLLVLFTIIGTRMQAISPQQLMNIDMQKDYSSATISELRLLKSMVYAKHGFLFMRSELRDYFCNNFHWYYDLILKNQDLKDKGVKVPPIVLTANEQAFVTRINEWMKQKSARNFIDTAEGTAPNLDNLGNYFKDTLITGNYRQKFGKYGFVIVNDSIEQLFHLYDINQYNHTPNFITTDLYLQLLHIYFAYTLKILEKDKLSPILAKLSLGMHDEALKYLSPHYGSEINEMARFNACYFAVAYTLITGENVSVPPGMLSVYHDELTKIDAAKSDSSMLFRDVVPYDLFLPRGYYTRTEPQKRYFKAMMWLQTAPFCLSDRSLLLQASFDALLLNNQKTTNNKSLKQLYHAVYDPIAFLIGEGDNLSVMDICKILTDEKITTPEQLCQPDPVKKLETKLRKLEQQKDQIQPKIKLTCYPKINFMPQRYLIDNDILQQFTDTTPNAEKAFPKGLEIFSVLGVPAARDLLYNHYKENTKWDQYDIEMQHQTEKFAGFENWDNTLYNKWLKSLLDLNKADKRYPYFMQTTAWQHKNLNTSLASWAELKHDVILYGEQPEAAEMGDGGDNLPPPVTVGYVEPNIAFWEAARSMVLTNQYFLSQYDLFTDELRTKSDEVLKLAHFFVSASNKELNRQPLTDQEYDDIEHISGRFDYLSLQMLNPYIVQNYWDEVKGPDKTIALVADIYTRNVPNCPKNGILHAATGLGNRIYVIVEIEGHLYLTRGAVFSYYEFPFYKRLTDEEWLDMLRQGQAPKPADWMQPYIIADPKPIIDQTYQNDYF